ncbi:MAG TPA: N-acetylmuramoyl-L-alanine amidase [Longimicrobiales bacterium]|nr:N-acetylmuramoyl-L-alanine amidase [Longimicrobiales bacterium]
MKATTSLATWISLVAFAGCATAPAQRSTAGPDTPPPVPGSSAAERTPQLPAIPAADGALNLEVGYPPAGSTIAVRDSNFIFGSTGSGRARLTINDAPVDVAPNGGFLAFLPVPGDGVYRLRASRDGETASLDHAINLPPTPATAAGPRITAPAPTGTWAVERGEAMEFSFRAPPGGQAAVVLPDGRRVPLPEQGRTADAPAGAQFLTDVPVGSATPTTARYAGAVMVDAPLLSADTAVGRPLVGTAALAVSEAVLEFIAAADTVRMPLRLNVSVLEPGARRVVTATPPASAAHDWTVRGRNAPLGPFHYFWPPGTKLTVTGQRDGFFRVRLADARTAWVPTGDVRLAPPGSPPAGALVHSVRFNPQPGWIDVRIPTGERLPFQVVEEENALHIDVFGATSAANFFQYGALDPLIRRAEWSQVADSVFRVSVWLEQPVWGYHTFFDGTDAVLLRIRRPPVIEPGAPLRGLRIMVDPGHGGEDRWTRGPTGLTEADANLYISLRLRDLLEQAGAHVIMTRETDTTVPLGDRPRMAADSGAHLLVSVHNNAFPDGVNPWQNAGTSMYYFHPHSAELARLLQHEMLEELGLRDIGYGRADLALVRPTWMPSVLSETMFMMIPEQEAALRDAGVQERIARAHVRAIERFLLGRAASQP